MSLLASSTDLEIFGKGDRFLTIKDEKIIEMSFIDKIWYVFSNSFRTQVQNGLQTFISQKIKQISISDGKDVNNQKIAKLFFEKLSFLPESIFDRSVIVQNKGLYNYLLSQISIEEEKKSVNEDNQVAFLEKIKRAKLSLMLGIKPVKGDGVSGSYLIKEIAPSPLQKYVGIFKPYDEESLCFSHPRILRRIINIVMSILSPFSSRYESCAGKGFLAEEAVFKVSQEIGLNIVPNTIHNMHVSSLDGREKMGSFQEFVHGCKPATEVFNVNKSFIPRMGQKNKVISPSNEDLDKLIILTYITGNFDSHAENYLFTDEGKPFSIDGGMSFSQKQPYSKLEMRYFLTIIRLKEFQNRKFTRQGQRFISEAFKKKEVLAKIIQNLYSPYEEAEKIDKRIEAMAKRIDILNYFVKQDKKITGLENLRSRDSIDTYDMGWSQRF